MPFPHDLLFNGLIPVHPDLLFNVLMPVPPDLLFNGLISVPSDLLFDDVIPVFCESEASTYGEFMAVIARFLLHPTDENHHRQCHIGFAFSKWRQKCYKSLSQDSALLSYFLQHHT